MAEVTVRINGRDYRIGCAEGEESRIGRLADYIDLKVQELIGQVGQIGDTQLLVMASLLVADELTEAYDKLETAVGGGAADAGLDQALGAIAERVEAIVARLESA